MSSNPSSTLATTIQFCLSANRKDPELICTRINDHGTHCCDEVSGVAWNNRGAAVRCSDNHDHSAEKGLAKS